jgi:hypothetical protein
MIATGKCELWHQHRVDDLIACSLAHMSYEEFLAYTEAHCRPAVETKP